MTKPRVVFVVVNFAAGGAETQVRRLAAGLAERNWAVTVMTLLPNMVEPAELDALGVERIHLQGQRGFRAFLSLPRLVKKLRQRQPAVCIGFMIPTDPLARMAGWLSRVPVISSLRAPYVGGPVVNFVLRRTDGMLAMLTTNTEQTKRSLGPKVTRQPERIKVILNALPAPIPMDEREARSAIRKELQIDGHEFLWLAVGAQRPEKNYPGLLQALQQVPGAKLIIAGDDLQREVLDQSCIRFGLGHRVLQLGRRTDVSRLLAAADGFVLASHYEGLPNALMEAMAAGKPVVATAVGGVLDLVEDRRNGLLVPPRDVTALAEALNKIVAMSAAERAKLGELARAQVVERYALPAVLDRWEALLNRVWAEHQRA